MNIGDRITSLRKEKNITRDDLAKTVGTSAAIIGRYERNEITPSVEVAAKIANAMDISLDYLVGNANAVIKDKKMIYRLELLEKINSDDKNTILKVIDSFLKDAQLNITNSRLA